MRAAHQLHEQLALDLQPFVERQVHRRFDAADVVFGGQEPAELAGMGLAEGGEDLGMGAVGFDLVGQVADLLQGPLLSDDLAGEGEGPLTQLAFVDEFIN